MSAVTYPRFAARRGAVRAATWWGKAWVRSVEEASYGEGDLKAARSLARDGRVGAIAVGPGEVVAVVHDPAADATSRPRLTLPVLGPDQAEDLVALVAAESGRIARLLAGELPHTLAEEAEEAGVELVPYAGELSWSCDCDSWTDPCRHGLALGYQAGWLLDADPLVLVLARGLSREELLARLHARHPRRDGAASSDPLEDPSDRDLAPEDREDLEAAFDAAVRAARILELVAQDRPFDHLL